MVTKCVILLGTLKKAERSNTEVLCDFFVKRAEKKGLDCEVIKLVDHRILPGTYSDMGKGDGWPGILKKILEAQVVIFASPVWWGGHSSEIQRVIERLDEIHDEILKGKESRLDGKVGGVIVTGDSDGAQNIIASVANYFNAVGVLMPPFTALTVLWDGQEKGARTSRKKLLEKYEKDYTKTADKMVEQLVKFCSP